MLFSPARFRLTVQRTGSGLRFSGSARQTAAALKAKSRLLLKNHKKDEIFIRENLVFLFCCSRLREDGADGCARARRALKLDAAVVQLHGVLDD